MNCISSDISAGKNISNPHLKTEMKWFENFSNKGNFEKTNKHSNKA